MKIAWAFTSLGASFSPWGRWVQSRGRPEQRRRSVEASRTSRVRER